MREYLGSIIQAPSVSAFVDTWRLRAPGSGKLGASLSNDRRALMNSTALLIGDALSLALALFGSYILLQWIGQIGTLGQFAINEDQFLHRCSMFSLTVLVNIVSFLLVGHYSKRKTFWKELQLTLKMILLASIFDASLMYLGKYQFSRLWFLSTWATALFVLPFIRAQVKKALIYAGSWMIPTAIIGAGPNARESADALADCKLIGLDVIAFLDPHQEVPSSATEGRPPTPRTFTIRNRTVPILPLGDMPDETLHTLGDPYVVFALESEGLNGFQPLVQRLLRKRSDIVIAPSIRGFPLAGMEVVHFFTHEVPLLRVHNNLARPGAKLVKRAFDITFACSVLAALSPVIAFLMIYLRRSGTSAFYGHKRVGQHGEPFVCYKFRSMLPNADTLLKGLLERDSDAKREWEANFKLKNDPRVTPLGAFLRRSSMDEVPQLWNVLKGEMSVVGPRPIIQAELARYGDNAGWYLEAKPGMTGLWQIHGRSDTDYARRVYLDAWYAKNWRLWYDCVIIVKTIAIVLARRGAY